MELINLPPVMAQNNLTLKYEDVDLSEYETLWNVTTRLPYFIEGVTPMAYTK